MRQIVTRVRSVSSPQQAAPIRSDQQPAAVSLRPRRAGQIRARRSDPLCHLPHNRPASFPRRLPVPPSAFPHYDLTGEPHSETSLLQILWPTPNPVVDFTATLPTTTRILGPDAFASINFRCPHPWDPVEPLITSVPPDPTMSNCDTRPMICPSSSFSLQWVVTAFGLQGCVLVFWCWLWSMRGCAAGCCWE